MAKLRLPHSRLPAGRGRRSRGKLRGLRSAVAVLHGIILPPAPTMGKRSRATRPPTAAPTRSGPLACLRWQAVKRQTLSCGGVVSGRQSRTDVGRPREGSPLPTPGAVGSALSGLGAAYDYDCLSFLSPSTMLRASNRARLRRRFAVGGPASLGYVVTSPVPGSWFPVLHRGVTFPETKS